MRLIKLCEIINVPVEEMRDFITETKSIILLSDYSEVPDEIVKSLFSDPETIVEFNKYRVNNGLEPVEIPDIPMAESTNEETSAVCDKDEKQSAVDSDAADPYSELDIVRGISLARAKKETPPRAKPVAPAPNSDADKFSGNGNTANLDSPLADTSEVSSNGSTETIGSSTDNKPGGNTEIRYTGRNFFTKSLLAYCINNDFTILTDTCTLMHDGFHIFYPKHLKQFLSAEKKLLIPYNVYLELKKHSSIEINDDNDATRKSCADRALALIESEMKDGYISVVGNQSDLGINKDGEIDIFADGPLLEKIMRLRNRNRNVLMLTDDRKLAGDIIHNNYIESVKASVVILALKLTPSGNLSESFKNPLREFNPELPDKSVYYRGDSTITYPQ